MPGEHVAAFNAAIDRLLAEMAEPRLLVPAGTRVAIPPNTTGRILTYRGDMPRAPRQDDGFEMRTRTWTVTRPQLYTNLNIDALFDAIETHQQPKRRDPNVANLIDHWLRTNWPELVGIRGVWFTGSSVWSHLYGENPRPGADLDIVCENDEAKNAVKDALLGKIRGPEEGEKSETSLGGERVYTTKGSLDIWKDTNPIQAIRNYSRQHSHARAIYSTTMQCLTVLPNEAAK